MHKNRSINLKEKTEEKEEAAKEAKKAEKKAKKARIAAEEAAKEAKKAEKAAEEAKQYNDIQDLLKDTYKPELENNSSMTSKYSFIKTQFKNFIYYVDNSNNTFGHKINFNVDKNHLSYDYVLKTRKEDNISIQLNTNIENSDFKNLIKNIHNNQIYKDIIKNYKDFINILKNKINYDNETFKKNIENKNYNYGAISTTVNPTRFDEIISTTVNPNKQGGGGADDVTKIFESIRKLVDDLFYDFRKETYLQIEYDTNNFNLDNTINFVT